MSERSINSALLALRKQLIRGDGLGLEHVEALLVMRGVALPCVLPAKRPDAGHAWEQCGGFCLASYKPAPRRCGSWLTT